MKRFMAVLAGFIFLMLTHPPACFAGLFNGGFNEGLSGWNVSGDVEVQEGVAVLRTGGVRAGVYETILSQEGMMDGGDGMLTFQYGFEAEGPDEVLDPDYPSFFPDSFQVTVESGSRHDSILLADRATGGLLPFSLDLGLSPGNPVRLTFSLLDEDDGRFSRAFLSDVRLGAEPVPEPGTLVLLGSGFLILFAGGRIPRITRCSRRLPWMPLMHCFVMALVLLLGPEARGESEPENVDDRIHFAFSSAVFDSSTGNLTGKVTVTNLWDQPLYPPLHFIITGISDPSVTVANPTGFSPEGFPFLDLSPLLREGMLQPGETTPPSDLSFHNPSRVRFRWTQNVLAVSDPPPAGPVIFNLCLIPGEQPSICEFLLEDFEIADPEFHRIQTVPLPEMYAHERVKVFVFDETFLPESLEVTIGGLPARIEWDGAFVADLLLKEGANEIAIVAVNPEGVAATRSINLVVDTQPPVIRLLTPEPGSRITESLSTLPGTVDDPEVSDLILTHLGQSVSIPVRDGTFSMEAAFPVGLNRITLEGRDRAGNPGIVFADIFRVNALEGDLAGRVFSGMLGAPLAGGMVTAAVAGDESAFSAAAVTGADGSYLLSGVPSGDLILTARREGYEPREIRAFSAGGNPPLVQDFDLTPVTNAGSLAVTGVIRDTGEIPLPGVRISADPLFRSMETGPDGIYLLQGLPREPFVLRAAKPGFDVEEVFVSGGGYDPSVTLLVHSMVLRQSPDAIILRHPVPGEILGGSGMVTGEVRPDLLDPEGETSVRVNGLPAYLVENGFMMNRPPLAPDSDALTVEVIREEGVAASETFPVDVDSGDDPFILLTSAENGVAPFRIFVRGSPEIPFTLRVEGPSPVEAASEGGAYAVTFSSPGIYVLEGEGVLEGKTVRNRIAVAVSDRGVLESLLQKRWSAMIGALALGDIERGLEQLTGEAAYRYRGLLDGMGGEGRRFFADLPGIEWVEMEDGMARTRLRKDDLSYPIWFARDLDGFYRIHRF